MHIEFYLYTYLALSIHVCSDFNPDTTFLLRIDIFEGRSISSALIAPVVQI